MKQILEGSQAIARIINNIGPQVVSAYPITPQTHIVEDLAKFKAEGRADYEYVRAESEFAAASIVAGASAAGVRTYTATSSQGLLLMTEVLYNIAGMRLPVVMTLANRGVSAPITIWNDHQDAMSVRDAGWIQLFAENHQEAIEQHLLAYKVAEKNRVPAMVCLDGFVLTHTYEDASVPGKEAVKKFLPAFAPAPGEFLDAKNPSTFGAFAAPAYYQEIREELHNCLLNSAKDVFDEYENLKSILPEAVKKTEKNALVNNGLVEYYGASKPESVLIAMGSLCGTIKDAVDALNARKAYGGVGVLKIKCYRPFPANEIVGLITGVKQAAVVEKAVSLGAADGPLALDVKSAAKNRIKTRIQGFVTGLGGRDITRKTIETVLAELGKGGGAGKFVG